MKWRNTKVPYPLSEEIEKILGPLGYASFQAFVSEALRTHIYKMKRRVDEIEQEREVGRKVLGKDDP
jgi:hypothetical protein